MKPTPDLVGLELAARAGYLPDASGEPVAEDGQGLGQPAGGARVFVHPPSGPDRIRELQQNVPKVQGLYQAARKAGWGGLEQVLTGLLPA